VKFFSFSLLSCCVENQKDMTRDSDFVRGIVQSVDEHARQSGVESPTISLTTVTHETPLPEESAISYKNEVEIQQWIERRFWSSQRGVCLALADMQMWITQALLVEERPRFSTFEEAFGRIYTNLDAYLHRCGIDRNKDKCVLILCTDSGVNEAREFISGVRSRDMRREMGSDEVFDLFQKYRTTQLFVADPRITKEWSMVTETSLKDPETTFYGYGDEPGQLPVKYAGWSLLRNKTFMMNLFYPLLFDDLVKRYSPGYDLILHGFHRHGSPFYQPKEIKLDAETLGKASDPVEGDFKIITWALVGLDQGYRVMMYSGDGDEYPASWIQLAFREALGEVTSSRWFWYSAIKYKTNAKKENPDDIRLNEKIVVHDVITFYELLIGLLPEEMPNRGLFWAVFCFLRGCDYTQKVNRFTLPALLKTKYNLRQQFIDIGEQPSGNSVFLWFELNDRWKRLIESCGLGVGDEQLAQAKFTLNEFFRQPRVWLNFGDPALPMALSIGGKPFYGFERTPDGVLVFASSAVALPYPKDEPLTPERLREVGRPRLTNSIDTDFLVKTEPVYLDEEQLGQHVIDPSPPTPKRPRFMPNAPSTVPFVSLRTMLGRIAVAPPAANALRGNVRSLEPVFDGFSHPEPEPEVFLKQEPDEEADETDPNWPFRFLSAALGTHAGVFGRMALARLRHELSDPKSRSVELIRLAMHGAGQKGREPILRAASDLFIFHADLVTNPELALELDSDSARMRAENEYVRGRIFTSIKKDKRLYFREEGVSQVVQRFGPGIPLPRAYQSFADMVDVTISAYLTRLLVESAVAQEATFISPELLEPAAGRFYSGGANLGINLAIVPVL
jgi:hypothetical protein